MHCKPLAYMCTQTVLKNNHLLQQVSQHGICKDRCWRQVHKTRPRLSHQCQTMAQCGKATAEARRQQQSQRHRQMANLVRVNNEVGLHVLLLYFTSLNQVGHARRVPPTSLPQDCVQSTQQSPDVVLHSATNLLSEQKRKKNRKENTTPFGANLMRSQVSYQAAQELAISPVALLYVFACKQQQQQQQHL